ncbi:uncharacterized protein LOC5512917 [Nematostella vectensis]|uniref:uncharacterized protein LOC5512917 n=1 Tax=Nematostella vectensis TaxID=45351 RepID=UPI0020773A90|nr:uncharacterized protein LOC5512917 [Nematostella vectensis]
MAEVPIIFHSRVKAPYNKLSNFYEVDLDMQEGVFPSVEHYFQGMKFIPEDRKHFTKGGKFDSLAKSSWPVEVSKGIVAKSAGSKSGSAKHGLTLVGDALDQNASKIRMKKALRVKFSKEPFRSLLLETGNRLLVHIPMRGQPDFWTARLDKASGRIIGENTMAMVVMEVRDEMRAQQDDGTRMEDSETAGT